MTGRPADAGRGVGAAGVPPPPRERAIRGDGTPEAVWQAWSALAESPALVLERWLPASRRLVVVAPHPDDEVLACGGLLQLHLAQGGRATVVALTDGEASHAGCAAWPPERLAPARRTESAAGLARLGAGAAAALCVVRLGLPDGLVARQAATLHDRLVALLAPADLVVATWRADGHPDHDAAGTAAAGACSTVGCELAEALVWMWHWSAPGDSGVPWSRLRRLPLPAGTRAAKRRALAEHATQLTPRDDGVGPVVVPSLVARCERDAEYYLV